jgi:hypothetical protein
VAASQPANTAPTVGPAPSNLDEDERGGESFTLILSNATFELSMNRDEPSSIQRQLSVDRRYQRNENDESQGLTFVSNRVDIEQAHSSMSLERIAFQTVLTTGIAIWVLQGAQILATILATTPAWIQLDPIAILPKSNSDELEDQEEEAQIFDGK